VVDQRQNFVNKRFRVWLLAVPIKTGLALPPGVEVKQPTVSHGTEHVNSQTFGLAARWPKYLHNRSLDTTLQSRFRVKSREDVQAIIIFLNVHVILSSVVYRQACN
jgi:hypothetical protein